MSTRELHLDVESRSTIDLTKTGAYAYWESDQTDTICAAFAVDDEPVQAWRRGDPVPELMKQAVQDGWLVFAHNAGFERLCLQHSLGPRYGWPVPDLRQYRCTAAMSAAMALPRALGNAALALGMDAQKDTAGRRLMLQMCKPRRVENGVPTWWEDEDRINRLVEYCKTDVVVEHGLTKRLRSLSAFEQEVWFLDQEINSRGVRIDVPNIKCAQHLILEATETANKRLARLTQYRVTAVSQATNLAQWLDEHGVDLAVEDKKAKAKLEAAQAEAAISDTDTSRDPIETQYRLSVDKRRVREALEVTTDPVVREVLELRQSTAKSSTAKLKSFLLRVSADGRVRENLMYHGAGTGRWSGKGVQLQNVPRGELTYVDVVGAISTMKSKNLEWLTLFGDPISVIASCLRGFVIAAPGKELVMADYANIEGRVLAWLAGELWKLDAFRSFDAGTGPDLYLVAAAGIYNVAIDTLNKKSPERQIGKVAELACGFQGGVGAFQTMATTYGVKVPDSEADEIKTAWRARHPDTVRFWAELEDAALEAVRHPNTVVWVGSVQRRDILTRQGKLAFLSRKGVLWMQLPSGRRLAYITPCIREKKMPWTGADGLPVYKEAVFFMGVNSLTKQWEAQSAYGGLWAENATQAVARDIMAAAMMRIRERGWDTILTVHDEVIIEAPIGAVTKDMFEAEMVVLPSWATGLPVTAEGDVSLRYRK